jgi:maleylpyruvate isomerase
MWGMTADPLVLLPEVDRATAHLLETARTLDDTAVAAPSLLPHWSRGHVLTHLARSADACVNLLTWARTGTETPAYASAEQREADIEAGAGRPAAEQVADLVAAARRFDEAVEQMPPEAWAVTVRTPSKATLAAYVPWLRLREVELHHVDLDTGYGTGDWPDGFVHRLLHELATDLADDLPPLRLHATDLDHELTLGSDPVATVSGPGHAIAAWLTGRAGDDVVTMVPEGPAPAVPKWK